jgi:hypothetical protein
MQPGCCFFSQSSTHRAADSAWWIMVVCARDRDPEGADRCAGCVFRARRGRPEHRARPALRGRGAQLFFKWLLINARRNGEIRAKGCSLIVLPLETMYEFPITFNFQFSILALQNP